MWTKPQVATFQRALATVEKHQAALDRLAEIAKHSPQFAERVKDLHDRAKNVKTLATVALTGDPHGNASE
jgi:hypothetical protein